MKIEFARTYGVINHMHPKGGGRKQAGSVALSGQASAAAAPLNVPDVTTQVCRQFEGDILERVAALEKAAASLMKEARDRAGRRHAEHEAERKTPDSLGLLGYPAKDWAREIENLMEGDSDIQRACASSERMLVTCGSI